MAHIDGQIPSRGENPCFGTSSLRSTSRARAAALCIVIACALGTLSCAPSISTIEQPLPAVPAAGALPATFKVISYNAWHGLETGSASVKMVEPPEKNEARLQSQVNQIASVNPDLVLLQEVNPLPERARAYVERLEKKGLEYDEIRQVDACGIRREGKEGLVPGLNNGLVILAKKELRLRRLMGLKLSGDVGQCEDTSGYQLEELRYALIGEITMPGTESRYLVVCLHLHSGFEAGTPFLTQMTALRNDGHLKEYSWIRWEIEQAQLRRIGELDTLMRELMKLQRETPYVGVVIGGDFNFEPDFPEHQEARLMRLTDTSMAAVGPGPRYTADPARNRNIVPGKDAPIPASLTRRVQGEAPATRDAVLSAYRAEKDRPRQIDYLFANRFLPEHCLRQDLFGLAPDPAGLPASDHFGLLNTYSRDTAICQQQAAGPSTSP